MNTPSVCCFLTLDFACRARQHQGLTEVLWLVDERALTPQIAARPVSVAKSRTVPGKVVLVV